MDWETSSMTAGWRQGMIRGQSAQVIDQHGQCRVCVSTIAKIRTDLILTAMRTVLGSLCFVSMKRPISSFCSSGDTLVMNLAIAFEAFNGDQPKRTVWYTACSTLNWSALHECIDGRTTCLAWPPQPNSFLPSRAMVKVMMLYLVPGYSRSCG